MIHKTSGRALGPLGPAQPAARTERAPAGEVTRHQHAANIQHDAAQNPGRLRIAVDFDGVLFDHIPYVLRGFRDAHGLDLAAEGLRYWDFFQYRAVREAGLTWNCVKTVLQRIDTDEAIHELSPRDAHAANVISRWRREGHQVNIVTARDPEARTTTERFLHRNNIRHDGLVMGASRKTGYDVLVDDAPHNVLMAAADGGLALLMDQPYNRDVPSKRNPLRVRHWHDVERRVEDAMAAFEAGLLGATA